MEIPKCLVCLNDCSPRSSIKKTEEILNGLTYDGDPAQIQLNAIFLLKKILGVPETVIFEFSQKYGDPNLWIDCCESCLILIEKVNHISKEIILLEENFKKVQCRITDKLVQSEHSENEFKNYFTSEASNSVRSYVCQAFANKSTEVPPGNAKLENTENSSVCIFGYQTPPDNEFSDIDSDADEEKRPQKTNESECYKCNTEIEKSVRLTETDYGDKNACVRTSGCKEGEQSYDSTEGEKGENCIKKIISNRKASKCMKFCETFTTEAKLLRRSCRNRNNKHGKNFSIGMGDEPFNHPSDLQVHTSEMSLKCELCEKMFSGIHALKSHVKAAHNGQSFKCELCEKCFPKFIILRRHVKTVHNGEKAFQCELCEKWFSEKNAVNIHVKTVHNGEKRFKCNVCDKRFPQKVNLNNHIRSVHNGERPYQCQLCQKWYSDKSTLNTHIKVVHNKETRVKTSEKTFKCHACEKQFKYKNVLKLHVSRVHNGERPFKCDLCEKRFSIKDSLNYHVKVIHNIWKPLNL